MVSQRPRVSLRPSAVGRSKIWFGEMITGHWRLMQGQFQWYGRHRSMNTRRLRIKWM